MTSERTAGGGELPKGKAKQEKGGGEEKREDFREKLKEAIKPPEPTPEEKKATAAAFMAEMPDARKILYVPLSSLQENPDNKRADYGDLKSLAASMEHLGVLQPLLVKPAEKPNRWVIIFGHRRFRAAKLAGLKEVPVDVREVADSLALEAQLVENVHRKDVNPMEECDTYDLLSRKIGYSPEQISERTGKSTGWVYARLKLRALCPEGRKAVKDGELAANVAVRIARIRSQAKQSEALTRVRHLSTREALAFLQDNFTKSLKGAPFDQKDPDLVPVKTEAGGFCFGGSCLKCPQRTGAAPDLFDQPKEEKGFDSCTHPPCFALKVSAAWEQKTASAKKKGEKVLSVAESKKLFHGANLAWNSGFVKAQTPAEDDAKKRTWSQLLERLPEAKQPEITIAADASGKPIKLVKKEEALAALAASGLKWAAEAEESRTSYRPQSEEEQAKGRREGEIREETSVRAVLRVGEKIRKLELPELRLLALSALRYDSERLLAQVAPEAKGAEKWIEEKAEPAELISLIFMAAAVEYCGRSWASYSSEFKDFAKRYEVPVSEIEKEVASELERADAEALAEKAKASPAVDKLEKDLKAYEAEGDEMVREMEKKSKKKAKKGEARP